MKLHDLMADAMAQLPTPRREAVAAIIADFEPSETCQFVLALVAGSTARERRMTRLLLNDIEKLDADI